VSDENPFGLQNWVASAVVNIMKNDLATSCSSKQPLTGGFPDRRPRFSFRRVGILTFRMQGLSAS